MPNSPSINAADEQTRVIHGHIVRQVTPIRTVTGIYIIGRVEAKARDGLLQSFRWGTEMLVGLYPKYLLICIVFSIFILFLTATVHSPVAMHRLN